MKWKELKKQIDKQISDDSEVIIIHLCLGFTDFLAEETTIGFEITSLDGEGDERG